MPLPLSIPIERVAGDRYSIDFQLAGLADITGMASQLRIAQTDGTLIGVIDGAVTDGPGGKISFDPDLNETVRDLVAGSYSYALVLDPSGAQRRTFAMGAYELVVQPVPSVADEVPAGGFSGAGYKGYVFATKKLTSDPSIDIYVHHTGSNTASGSQSTPVASVEEAFGRVPLLNWGQRLRVICNPGHTETINRNVFLPPIMGGGQVDDLALDGTDPSWDYIRQQITLQASPTTIEDVNGTISVLDAKTSFILVTDATKNWTTNQHVGKGIINPGVPAQNGVIFANTATTLSICMVNGSLSDGGIRIVDRGASLTFNGSTFVTSGLMISGGTASMATIGIKIAAPAGPAVDIMSHSAVSFLLCEISGGVQSRIRSGEVTMDSCYLHGGAFALNGGVPAVRQCLISGMTTAFHAVNGQYDLYSCYVTGCGSMGHGGTSTPHGGFRIDNCWITNATSHGVLDLGGSRSRIQNSRIDSCAGDAIHVEGCGSLLVNNVTGSGSTGYGCNIDNGAIVTTQGTVDVAGASGQVLLGSGGTVYTWAQAPQNNASRLCRFGA